MILIIGLTALAAVPPTALGTQIISIRHGVHQNFDRVVFDLSESAHYEVDSRHSNTSIYVSIDGISSQESAPNAQLSSTPKVVSDVVRVSAGTFQIRIQKPVVVRSFTISGSIFRIVIDLFLPDEASPPTVSSAVSSDTPSEENTREVAPEQAEVLDTDHQQESAEPNPEIVADQTMDKNLIYDFNSMYNMKQSAIRMQTIGNYDSAAMCWEDYLIIAKELHFNAVGEDFAFGNGSKNS